MAVVERIADNEDEACREMLWLLAEREFNAEVRGSV